jgi:hypothetical protein
LKAVPDARLVETIVREAAGARATPAPARSGGREVSTGVFCSRVLLVPAAAGFLLCLGVHIAAVLGFDVRFNSIVPGFAIGAVGLSIMAGQIHGTVTSWRRVEAPSWMKAGLVVTFCYTLLVVFLYAPHGRHRSHPDTIQAVARIVPCILAIAYLMSATLLVARLRRSNEE